MLIKVLHFSKWKKKWIWYRYCQVITSIRWPQHKTTLKVLQSKGNKTYSIKSVSQVKNNEANQGRKYSFFYIIHILQRVHYLFYSIS